MDDKLDDKLSVGDRVINLQIPGIFRVIAREGSVLTIEAEKGGVRMTLEEVALRRPLEDAPPPEDETSSEDD